MNRLVSLIAALAIFSLAGAAFAETTVKLGSVDAQKIALESARGKKASETIKEMADKYQAKVDAKRKELEKLKSDLERNGAKMSATKRNAKGKELQKKIGEFQEFGLNAEQELAKKQKELSAQVGEELEKTIREFGRKNGYTLIVHKEGILYNSGDYGIRDVTDDIQKIFNAPPTQETTPKK